MDCCRFCGKINDKSVYKDVVECIDIVHKVLPIVVKRDDNLPKKMCSECYLKLSEIGKFFDQVLNLEESYRKTVSSSDCLTDNKLKNKEFVEHLKENDSTKESFIVRHVEDISLFLCKTCQRTYVSEASAAKHVCNSLLIPHFYGKSPPKESKLTTNKKKLKITTGSAKSNGGKMKRKRYSDDHGCYFTINKPLFNKEDKTLFDVVESESPIVQSYQCHFCKLLFSRRATLDSHEHDHLLELSHETSDEDST